MRHMHACAKQLASWAISHGGEGEVEGVCSLCVYMANDNAIKMVCCQAERLVGVGEWERGEGDPPKEGR